MDIYYAYEANEECHACIFNKTVLDDDCTPYTICFKPYDKSRIFKDEPCKYYMKKP